MSTKRITVEPHPVTGVLIRCPSENGRSVPEFDALVNANRDAGDHASYRIGATYYAATASLAQAREVARTVAIRRRIKAYTIAGKCGKGGARKALLPIVTTF